jgi:hypothetical protein
MAQKIFIKMRFVPKRKIQVFGKPVRLKIALLQAGSAFKNPGI